MIGGRVGGLFTKDAASNAAWGAAGIVGSLAAFRLGKRLKTSMFTAADNITPKSEVDIIKDGMNNKSPIVGTKVE